MTGFARRPGDALRPGYEKRAMSLGCAGDPGRLCVPVIEWGGAAPRMAVSSLGNRQVTDPGLAAVSNTEIWDEFDDE